MRVLGWWGVLAVLVLLLAPSISGHVSVPLPEIAHPAAATRLDARSPGGSGHSLENGSGGPSPSVSVDPSFTVMDSGQVVQLWAVGSGGYGPPAAWNYSWWVDGEVVGQGVEINYTTPDLGPGVGWGDLGVTVEGVDLAGQVARGSVNLTEVANPKATVEMDSSSVDVGGVLAAGEVISGGVSPFSTEWAIRTPSGWVRPANATPQVELPTFAVGNYEVMVNVTDGRGVTAESSPLTYEVAGPPQADFQLSAASTGNAVSVGAPVQLTACHQQGGSAPFFVAFDLNGTSLANWTALGPDEVCASARTSYASPRTVWAAAGWEDADGENTSSVFSFDVLDPATLPQVPTSTIAHVGLPTWMSVVETAPHSAITWNISNSTELSPRELPNGTLFLQPAQAGTFRGTVQAQVEVEGFAIGPPAQENFSITVLGGAASTITTAGTATGSSLVVGTNATVVWEAWDAPGTPSVDFTEAVRLSRVGEVRGPAQVSYVNATGERVLVPEEESAFDFPASAWVAGALTVEVSQTWTGSSEYQFVSPLLPGGGAFLNFTWNPDLRGLQLSEPRVWMQNTTSNQTLWQVSDAYGNAVPEAFVWVESTSGGASMSERSDALEIGNCTWVWVNYTFAGDSGGSVAVLGMFGEPLLPQFTVPGGAPAGTSMAVPSGPPGWAPLAVGAVAGALGGRRSLVRDTPRAGRPPSQGTSERAWRLDGKG